MCGGFLDLRRVAPALHQRDTQTLTTSRRYHRKVSGNKYSQNLPPGYASTSCHRRLSGSRYSRRLPLLYVVSQLQLRRCLLAVSPSNYEIPDWKTKRLTRSSSRCWNCQGQAKEREQEDCSLAVHTAIMECLYCRSVRGKWFGRIAG